MKKIPLCCIWAAEKKLMEKFPDYNFSEQDSIIQNLRTGNWGEITDLYFDNMIIRTSDSPEFTGARVLELSCSNNHIDRYLVIIGTRFFLFLWRLSMILSDAWIYKKEGIVELKDLSKFPTEDHFNQLRIAFNKYFGEEEINLYGLEELNKIIFSKPNIISTLNSSLIVEAAELFLLFHEYYHHGKELVKSSLPNNPAEAFDFEIRNDRASRWISEIKADTNAMKLLILVVWQKLENIFPTQSEELRRQLTLSLTFNACDLALYTTKLIEEAKFGNISITEAASHGGYTFHPTAEYRQSNLSHFAMQLTLNQYGTQMWNSVRQDVGANRMVRENFINNFYSHFS